jgi:hypothetical protein
MDWQLPTITLTGGTLGLILGMIGWYVNKKYEAAQKKKDEDRVAAKLVEKTLTEHIKECSGRAVTTAEMKKDIEHLKGAVEDIKTGQGEINSKIDSLGTSMMNLLARP